MPYVEIQPSAALRPWIVCYWSRSGDSEPVGVRVLPDGCADVIFDLGGEPFAVGTMTRPLIVEPTRREYLGARFRPGRAAFFFRASLSSLTDQRLSLRDLLAGWSLVAEKLSESRTLQERVDVLNSSLERALTNAESDPRVDAAVAAILRSRGSAAIDDVAAGASLSRQHLGRLFAHHVGISPKSFSRVTRFRALLDLRCESWADAALQLGYTDQSHLIAEFREYTGATPVPFFLSRRASSQ